MLLKMKTYKLAVLFLIACTSCSSSHDRWREERTGPYYYEGRYYNHPHHHQEHGHHHDHEGHEHSHEGHH